MAQWRRPLQESDQGLRVSTLSLTGYDFAKFISLSLKGVILKSN